jgi:hypothetical protein
MIKIQEKIVGSYHKTGTVLLQEIFTRYCKKTKEKINFFQNFFTVDVKFLKNKKSLAMIRHPYEIIVSGWRYHLKGTEEWLHRPFIKQKSYVENLKDIRNIEEQINFEIKFCSQKIIKSIYQDIKQKKETLFIKLENFWDIESKIELSDMICDHMNLNIDIFAPIAIKQSEKKHNSTNQNFCHTWPDLLTQKNIDLFNSLLPSDTFEVMGYPRNLLKM